MPTYARFEKKTSRGTLSADVAIEGRVLYTRARRGENKKTGRVGTGITRSTTTCASSAIAQERYQDVVRELLAQRYAQVRGPRVGAPSTTKANNEKGRLVAKGEPRPATEADIAAFEARRDIRLPRSYRRFVIRYGAGELIGFVRIHSPRARGRCRLDALVKACLVRAEVEEGSAPSLARFLGQFVAFADTAGGDLLGWSLAEPARRGGEPSVFLVERNATRPRKVAPSFARLVRGLTSEQRFVEMLFGDLDAARTFVVA